MLTDINADFLDMRFPDKIKSSKSVYLCGAGISKAPPANVPIVSDFLFELYTLFKKKVSIEHKLLYRLLYGDEIYAPLRFEQIVSCFMDFDDELHCLDYLRITDVDECRPNLYHLYLAQELVCGATVITTNFDSFIEVALNKCYGLDISEVSGMLLKVHGSVQTVVGGRLVDNSVPQLKADIFSVSAGNAASGENLSLEYILDFVLDKYIYVFGYSFSDSYDVTPVLKKSMPKKAFVFEYKDDDLYESLDSFGFSGFYEIWESWRSRGVCVEVWAGNPMLYVEKHIKICRPESEDLIVLDGGVMPDYEIDELYYLAGRILIEQSALKDANVIFDNLKKKDCGDLHERVVYNYLRTMDDWPDMLSHSEEALKATRLSYYGSLIYVLLLNAASFVGPLKLFASLYKKFLLHIGGVDCLAPDQKVDLIKGRSYHCLGNYYLNTGRPMLAEIPMRKSLELRVKYGSPIDIVFAEHGLCLSLLHQNKIEAVEQKIIHIRDYVKKNDDIYSRICLKILEGLMFFKKSLYWDAYYCFNEANDLYKIGEDDLQRDPELELYILGSMCRLHFSVERLTEYLSFIEGFVRENGYCLYYEVIDVFWCAFSGKHKPNNMGPLANMHALNAHLW